MTRALGLLAAIVVAGCLAPLPPEPLPVRPSASATPSGTPLPPSGPPVAEATPGPTEPPRDVRCAPLTFDALAVPGPEFAEDIFVRDESRTITEAFLVGLSALYAGGSNVDRCDLFTDRGLATMLLADRHLAAADRRELLVHTSPVLRVAFEDDYDLRITPPRVPIDAIFDLPAGATVTDPRTAASVMTTQDERIGLHLVFAYDGHRWRVDEAGPVSTANAEWATLPGPLPPGPKCEGFRRDPAGARYDDRPGRVWCDGNGKGHRLRIDQELSIVTRYPCTGQRDDPDDRTAARGGARSPGPTRIRPRPERPLRREWMDRCSLRRRHPVAEGRLRHRLDERQRRPLGQPQQSRPWHLPGSRRRRRALGSGDRLVGSHRLPLKLAGQSIARSIAPTTTSPAGADPPDRVAPIGGLAQAEAPPSPTRARSPTRAAARPPSAARRVNATRISRYAPERDQPADAGAPRSRTAAVSASARDPARRLPPVDPDVAHRNTVQPPRSARRRSTARVPRTPTRSTAE